MDSKQSTKTIGAPDRESAEREQRIEAELAAWAPAFTPKQDARTQNIKGIMKDGSAIPFVAAPLVRAATKIFATLDETKVGAIVVGSKMGGKSQTLEFLSQFLSSRTECTPFVFKITMKREGKLHPPDSPREFYFKLVRVFFQTGGVLDQCKTFLLTTLANEAKNAGENSKTESESLDLSDNSVAMQKYFYGVIKERANLSLPELAVAVLAHQQRMPSNSGGAFTMETVASLMQYVFELFLRSNTFLDAPCYVFIDEVGEALNGGLTGIVRNTSDNCVMPIISMLQEQTAFASRMFVILSGSTSVASYVVKQHLQEFECRIDGFNGSDCVELWKAWRSSLADMTEEQLDAAELWMQDVTASTTRDNDTLTATVVPQESNIGGDEVSNQDLGVMHLSDGVPGCVVELFRVAIGRPPRDAETLSHLIDLRYNALKEYLTKRDGGKGAETMQKLLLGQNFAAFSQFGLSRSLKQPPSAPILRRLFSQLRTDIPSKRNEYMNMLDVMAGLDLSGSFKGAVYQEQVLNNILMGNPLYVRNVTHEDGDYTFGSNFEIRQGPAMLYLYRQGEIKPGVYLGPLMTPIEQDNIEQAPKIWVYVAESQTFPSIDLTIAIANEEDDLVTLCHCSVSIDKKHFSSALLSKNGHLPLHIQSEPPSLLRSARAKKEMETYRDAVLGHELLTSCNSIDHVYGVFDDNSIDLLTPTAGFDASYWHLSTQRIPSPNKKIKTSNVTKIKRVKAKKTKQETKSKKKHQQNAATTRRSTRNRGNTA